MDFDQFTTEDRRLTLLKGLEAAVQYRANDYLLRTFAASLGHAVSRDRILADLDWLREQGLVTTSQAQGVLVATLTARGQDVAAGLATCPGVKKPLAG